MHLTILLSTLALLISGCDNSYSKYSSSNQGIPQQQLPIEKVKVGMEKENIERLLGRPHINPFYPQQWTYIYLQNGKQASKKVIIHFENDKVSRVQHG